MIGFQTTCQYRYIIGIFQARGYGHLWFIGGSPWLIGKEPRFNFASESWGGDPWKQSKRAKNEGGKTLQKTGQLAASLTTQSSNDFARIGTNKVYAAIHHMGGQAGRGCKVNIPARPYLPINGSGNLQANADKQILDIVKDALAPRRRNRVCRQRL